MRTKGIADAIGFNINHPLRSSPLTANAQGEDSKEVKKWRNDMRKWIFVLTMFCTFHVHAQQNLTSGSCAKENTDSSCEWSYDSNTRTLTITGIGAMADYEQNTQPWPKEATKIEIADGITSIGARAFQYVSVSEINLPDTITSIGQHAFDFSQLSKINIPDSVTSIKDYAFRGATHLTDVVVPDTVQRIDRGTFSYCTRLHTLTIGDNTRLNGDIFYRSSIDTGYTDTVNLKIYCTGNTATCDANLAAAGYGNLKSEKATTKKINGVTYVYDKNGKLVTTSGNRTEKRIYTLDEANAIAGPVNRVSIRYK